MIILHTNDANIANQISNKLVGQLQSKLDNHINFFLIQAHSTPFLLAGIRKTFQVDINIFPEFFNFNKTKLILSDMDSTLINIECMDEMAKVHGVGREVVAITEMAMQGKLDFNQSLKHRLALLKGFPVEALSQIYHDILRFNPGSKTLIDFLNQHNIHSALVSGGFDFFAKRVIKDLGIQQFLANTLVIKKGQLTGEVEGDIIDGQKKQQFLAKLCTQLNINIQHSIAMGDGSNDLLMMQASGLSVAYHAKPIVKEKADIVIEFGGLDILLDFFTAQTVITGRR